MRQFYLIILLISLILSGQGLISLTCAQDRPFGFHFKKKHQKKIHLDFEQYNNLIVVPVQINNSDTLNFVLDTGVGYTLVTDPKALNHLDLNCIRQITVAGAGSEQELRGCIVHLNSIRVDDIEAQNHNVIVLEKDVLHLSSYAGVKIHGLIGYDLFSRFVVKINYQHRKLVIHQPDKFKPTSKGETFPISIEQMKPYIQAEAFLNEAERATVKLILDTGAGHSLSLEAGSHPSIQVPERNITAHIGMTLNGAVNGAVGRINKFKLGSYEMQG
ncbi:MAG: hypothetical protein HC880_02350 [Bacteroidia bacterium]|nr:hypothetical protein [Bacteroidia bacterium]